MTQRHLFSIMFTSLFFASSLFIGCGDDTSDDSSDEMTSGTEMMTSGTEMMTSGTEMMTSGTEMMTAGMANPGPMISTAEIQEIFNTGCAGCHINGVALGNLSLDDFEATTINVASTIPNLMYIVPGDHTQSYLWHKLKGTHIDFGGTGGSMPTTGPIPDPEINLIARYIDQLN